MVQYKDPKLRQNSGYDFTIYTFLKSKLDIVYLTSQQDETIIRCPFCGDSSSSSYHAHLYIKNTSPFLFFCHRCEMSGYGKNLIKALNLFDTKIIQTLNRGYDEYLKKSNIKGTSKSVGSSASEFDFLPTRIGDIETRKLAYFESRLGWKLSPTKEDLSKFRYILNLEDFFIKNKLDPTKIFSKVSPNTLKMLNENYTAFLISNGNDIVCRYMGDIPAGSSIKRYMRLTLSHYGDRTRKFYTIQNKIDISLPVHTIYITEGIWDILGLYAYNDFKMDPSTIYIANNGKGFAASLNYLLNIGVTNANIFIYGDADVGPAFYRKFLAKNPLAKFNGVTLYTNQEYNTNKIYKDFGVPKDHISLSLPQKIL